MNHYTYRNDSMTYKTLFELYVCECYVETGTGGGGTLSKALQCDYKKCISIEPWITMYEQCTKKFKAELDDGRLNLYNGKSEKILKSVLPKIHTQITFFLDAHQNHPIERFNAGSNPIMEELAIIKNHTINTHTIICDDYEHFQYMGTTLQDVESAILNINPNYTIEKIPYVNGVLVAHI